MLPFLKRNKEAAASAPAEKVERKPDSEPEEMDLLASCAEEIMNAKNAKELAASLHAFFEICESMPHEENNA